ncbi:MAG: hypothetical protein K0Q76_3937 [Panacagrimonas sp.]|jgi:uncharacterized protein YbjT (DUF2867 family)|nr:NAD(P)H-binding protein [Panacagrimonas sp.]MCC2658829.1 hypothetical protein [Panacagrimonas sp.]
MTRIAVVAGHTGLVGRHLLDLLLQDARYTRVIAVGRRAPERKDPRLDVVTTGMDDLSRVGAKLAADDAFCCLGTTIRAAGSKAAFERVDFHMVVDFGRAARAAGARRCFVVSSLSADARSPIYYSRIKGKAEQALGEIGFDALHIVRPSLLLGTRSEHRPGEALAQRVAPLIGPLMRGALAKYRPIEARDVAQSLVALSRRGEDERGTFVHTLPLSG